MLYARVNRLDGQVMLQGWIRRPDLLRNWSGVPGFELLSSELTEAEVRLRVDAWRASR